MNPWHDLLTAGSRGVSGPRGRPARQNTPVPFQKGPQIAELRQRMHQPVPQQGIWLRQVVTGFFAYHAVPTNFRALGAFRLHITRLWRRVLRCRSQKDGATWTRIEKLADFFLPKPRILHPWPSDRFAVKHPRWEPYAGKPRVRFCAGAPSNGRPYRDPGPLMVRQPMVLLFVNEEQAVMGIAGAHWANQPATFLL